MLKHDALYSLFPQTPAGADGARGGGGTPKHCSQISSVWDTHEHTAETDTTSCARVSVCVCLWLNCGSVAQGQDRRSGWCEREDLRVDSLQTELGTLSAQLVLIAGDFHDGFPVALSADQRRCVSSCTYTAEQKRSFTCKWVAFVIYLILRLIFLLET